MKELYQCNRCNLIKTKKDIAYIINLSQIDYRGLDAKVICKDCEKKTKRVKKK